MDEIMKVVREIDATIASITKARDEMVQNWERDCVLGPSAEDFYKYQAALAFANDQIDKLIRQKYELLKR